MNPLAFEQEDFSCSNRLERRGMNMRNIPIEIKKQSIESLQSTIRKMEKAASHMHEKQANTTLLEKRLNACRIGLAVLESSWYNKTLDYTPVELQQAHLVLERLLPSLTKQYMGVTAQSPQQTLLARRIKAVELAIQAIQDLTK